MNKFIGDLMKIVSDEFSEQASLISGIIIGMIVSSLYNKFIGERKLTKSYDNVIKSKDEHIESLKKAIYDKLKLVQVDKKDKSFFDKLLRYFK